MSNGTFTVSGTGTFPFDMLRYDECWPASIDDARKMNCPYCEREKGETSKRTITLNTASRNAPTHKRWESFTWRVNTD